MSLFFKKFFQENEAIKEKNRGNTEEGSKLEKAKKGKRKIEMETQKKRKLECKTVVSKLHAQVWVVFL